MYPEDKIYSLATFLRSDGCHAFRRRIYTLAFTCCEMLDKVQDLV